MVFWRTAPADWQFVNVSEITRQKIAGPVARWQTPDGPYLVEHLAGQNHNGDLLVFWSSPQTDWQVVNVSGITGQQIAGPVTSWQTQDGPYLVQHLAGQSPTGDLLVFWWSPQTDWQVVNVSGITGQQIAGPVTSWQTQDGPYLAEHLAGQSPTGDLLEFWWSPQTDWRVVNVSGITGQQIAGPVESWVTGNAEQLAALGPNSDPYVFWRTPSTNWQVGNAIRTDDPPGIVNIDSFGAPSLSDSILASWPAMNRGNFVSGPDVPRRVFFDGMDLGTDDGYPDGWCFIGEEAIARFGSLTAEYGGGVVCKPGPFDPYGWPPGLGGGGGSSGQPPPPPPPPPRTIPPPLGSQWRNWGPAGESMFVTAGVSTAKDALKATQGSSPVFLDYQKEYGAVLFEYQGNLYTTPFTEGTSFFQSPRNNEAHVDVPKMIDTLPAVDGVTITGFIHSHPKDLGFDCNTKDGNKEHDIVESQYWWNMTSRTRPDGRKYKVNFKAHFISAPEGGVCIVHKQVMLIAAIVRYMT
jgi:hypothetical protein